MRVGLLVDSALGSAGGIGRYTAALARRLPDLPGLDVELLSTRHNERQALVRSMVRLRRIPLLPRSLASSLSLFLSRRKYDVVHDPAQAGLLLPSTAKRILTVHDITPILFPTMFGRLNGGLYRAFSASNYRNVDHIICDSQSTAHDVMRECKVRNAQLSVVHLAADEDFRRATDSGILAAKKLYGLPNEYLLFVGTIEPRKNLPGILEAVHRLWQRGTRVPLVVVGKIGWMSKPLLARLDEAKNRRQVVHLGYVDRQNLAAIYSGADALLYPSFYEGFGIPILEAMGCEVPVVTSNLSSMPEVAGDAAALVDPHDPSMMVDAILRLRDDVRYRRMLVERGKRRVSEFSWDRTAAQVAEIYQRVATG